MVGESGVVAVCKSVEQVETNVVTGLVELGAGIAEADY